MHVYIHVQRVAHASPQAMKKIHASSNAIWVSRTRTALRFQPCQVQSGSKRLFLVAASNRTWLSLLQFCGIYVDNWRYLILYNQASRECDSVQLLQPCPFQCISRKSRTCPYRGYCCIPRTEVWDNLRFRVVEHHGSLFKSDAWQPLPNLPSGATHSY